MSYPKLCCIAFWALLVLTSRSAVAEADNAPLLAVVIDDLGYRRDADLRAVELPGPMTYAVLPHTPYAVSMARLSRQLGKEVFIHMPMEALSDKRLGPGGLTASMDRAQFVTAVRSALTSMPNAIGMSNHMGSRLTGMERQMSWLMATLSAAGMRIFLDSQTVGGTVAAESARAHGLIGLSRDVFLDHLPGKAFVRKQIEALKRIADSRGWAIGIGHPHPHTIEVLDAELPGLKRDGYKLVTISQLLTHLNRRAHAARDRNTHSSTGTVSSLSQIAR